MNLRNGLVLLTLAAAIPAFASGAASPQPEPTPAPTPAPAPEPEPAPVDPTLGTRFATLRDMFNQATSAPALSSFQTFPSNPPAYYCVQINKSYPDAVDYDVSILQMKPFSHNPGPAFPQDLSNRLVFVRPSQLGSYTEQSITNEAWDATEQTIKTNEIEVVLSGSNVYDVRQNGTLVVWHYQTTNGYYESYGYCFPQNGSNPLR